MVELVGGAHLVTAHGVLAANGVLVAAGHISGDGERFPYGALFGNGHRHNRQITTFYLLDDSVGLSADLTWLSALTARGELDPQVALRTDWTQVARAAAEPAGRRVPGKAVIDVRRADRTTSAADPVTVPVTRKALRDPGQEWAA
ncbi:hypothetical protein [Streptomyces sp. MST-110588]|uniref:hypothetical protein n=1 Tax=Streptomyces sp. MST-110588 TaxID=2833628 RepID=UPI001F5C4A62|nr:hypothetical protein [Streptomyces sp. MST-110588]